MVLHMICNYKKCRKPLITSAWITSCSHVFCEEHGENEFRKRPIDTVHCPACNSQLRDKFDVVQADLNPPEGFKSVVLAGMNPDIIMDVAMRAMSFWAYQIEEEAKYQENIGKHAKEREELYALNLQKIKAELQCGKNKIELLQTECNNQKRQVEECSLKLEERNRKIQKLQHELDCQKRNAIRINSIDDYNKKTHNVSDLITNRYQETPNFMFQPQIPRNKGEDSDSIDSTPPNLFDKDDFVFRPVFHSKKT